MWHRKSFRILKELSYAKIDDIAFVRMTSRDVVRHPLVQKIVKAYEAYEAKENNSTKRRSRNTVYGKKQ